MKYLNYVFAIVIINYVIIGIFGLTPWPAAARSVSQNHAVSIPVQVTPQPVTPTPNTTTTSVANAISDTQSPTQPPIIPTDTPMPAAPTCIVSIQGRQYDVQRLRSTHSGGDIFVCGSDMTGTFFSMHNQSLLDGAMQQYLIQ